MGSKSLSPKFKSVTISYVPRQVTFLSLELPSDKNEDVIETTLSGCSELGTKASYSVFVFQAILDTRIIPATSWHISVVRLRLVWACGYKGTG